MQPCQREPAVPEIDQDAALVGYLEDRRTAGANCRLQLDSLQDYLRDSLATLK